MSVALDVLAPVLHLVAHELANRTLCGGGVVDGHALQDAGARVHGGGGQLLGVHLAQALVALDGVRALLLLDLAVGGVLDLLVIVVVKAQLADLAAQT